MGRKPKYSKEVKIKACKDYESGNGSFANIAKNIGTIKSVVNGWYLIYKNHGPNAFETTSKNRSYSKEFKLSVIEEYNSGKYSLTDLSGYGKRFKTLEELKEKIVKYIKFYNEKRFQKRLGCMAPLEYRKHASKCA